MNWTGGRLSRHSRNQGYSLTSRQKQRFAKVESNLRSSGQKNCPLKWSIFGNLVEEHLTQRFKDGEQSREQSQPPRPYHTCKGGNGPAPSSKSRQHIMRVKREQTSTPEDDLYNATPPPPKEKGRQEVPFVSSSKQVETKETDSEKRRKLLEKSDWVGTSMNRPITMAFRYPEHGEDVGRRRKIPDGHRVRYNSKQTRIESPFATRRRNVSLDGWHNNQQPRAQARSDVRISIGGRVVPPGVSSGTAPSRRYQNSHATQFLEQSQSTSSDVMLLDDDIVGPDGDSNMGEAMEEGSAHTREGIHDSSGGYLEESSQKDVYNANTSTRANRLHSEQNHPNEPHTSLQKAMENGGNQSNILKHTQSPLLGVFNLSSASIHHPKPQSSRISLLLQSDSSGFASSTVAQIGRIQPVVPSSQILDNEIWETWMAPLNDENRISNSEDLADQQYQAQRNSISPGMSEASFGFQGNQKRVSSEFATYGGRSSRMDARDTAEENERNSLDASYTRATPTEHLLVSSPLASQKNGIVSPDDQVLQEDILPPAKNGPSYPKSLPKKIVNGPDLDNVWKKFVFGSSSDGSELASRQDTQSFNFPGRSQSYSTIFGKGCTTKCGPRRIARFQRPDSPVVSSTCVTVDVAPRHLNTSSSAADLGYHKLQATASTGNLSLFNSRPTSIHATQGSIPSSTSRLTLASAESTPFRGSRTKVVVIKPNPFIKEIIRKHISAEELRPLQIGSRWNQTQLEDGGSGEIKKRDFYSLVGSDDLVESIEDD